MEFAVTYINVSSSKTIPVKTYILAKTN